MDSRACNLLNKTAKKTCSSSNKSSSNKFKNLEVEGNLLVSRSCGECEAGLLVTCDLCRLGYGAKTAPGKYSFLDIKKESHNLLSGTSADESFNTLTNAVQLFGDSAAVGVSLEPKQTWNVFVGDNTITDVSEDIGSNRTVFSMERTVKDDNNNSRQFNIACETTFFSDEPTDISPIGNKGSQIIGQDSILNGATSSFLTSRVGTSNFNANPFVGSELSIQAYSNNTYNITTLFSGSRRNTIDDIGESEPDKFGVRGASLLLNDVANANTVIQMFAGNKTSETVFDCAGVQCASTFTDPTSTNQVSLLSGIRDGFDFSKLSQVVVNDDGVQINPKTDGGTLGFFGTVGTIKADVDVSGTDAVTLQNLLDALTNYGLITQSA